MQGVLIAESLRTGSVLDDAALRVRKISRNAPEGVTQDQPKRWTLLGFEVDEGEAGRLARRLADVLDDGPWYVDFRSDREVYVVFPGRVFRYPRGDEAGRAEAIAHGRSIGIPEGQLDWPV